jgi:hypothetical protein
MTDRFLARHSSASWNPVFVWIDRAPGTKRQELDSSLTSSAVESRWNDEKAQRAY